jgi:hypothetical protein
LPYYLSVRRVGRSEPLQFFFKSKVVRSLVPMCIFLVTSRGKYTWKA